MVLMATFVFNSPLTSEFAFAKLYFDELEILVKGNQDMEIIEDYLYAKSSFYQNSKQYKKANLDDALALLKSEYHEVRLCAVFFMVAIFERARSSPQEQRIIVEAYLANTQYINNWDLVDSSAHKILGKYLLDKERETLHKLSHSNNLWEKRISMMATYTFIKEQQFEDTFRIAKTLLNDSHDLIHKIVGWMLREVGNQNKEAEEAFLLLHYKKMPRTMLRYAIEKFSKEERTAYLKGLI